MRTVPDLLTKQHCRLRKWIVLTVWQYHPVIPAVEYIVLLVISQSETHHFLFRNLSLNYIQDNSRHIDSVISIFFNRH